MSSPRVDQPRKVPVHGIERSSHPSRRVLQIRVRSFPFSRLWCRLAFEAEGAEWALGLNFFVLQSALHVSSWLDICSARVTGARCPCDSQRWPEQRCSASFGEVVDADGIDIDRDQSRDSVGSLTMINLSRCQRRSISGIKNLLPKSAPSSLWASVRARCKPPYVTKVEHSTGVWDGRNIAPQLLQVGWTFKAPGRACMFLKQGKLLRRSITSLNNTFDAIWFSNFYTTGQAYYEEVKEAKKVLREKMVIHVWSNSTKLLDYVLLLLLKPR